MTLEPERKQQLDEALLESLLRESYTSNPDDSLRIAQVLTNLDTNSVATTVTNTARVRSSRTVQRWISLTLAASILIAAGYAITNLVTSNAAYAAVMRSLESVPATRAYRVRMVHQRPVWGKREVLAELYLNDRDQFVVRHPGWSRFNDMWIGGDAKNRWIVPRFGPAFTGGEAIVGGWLTRKDILSPYLHVETVLERMSRVYQLQLLDNESLPHVDSPETLTECQHIRGKLRGGHRGLPAQIELWADIETGIARRLELTWNRQPSERGPVSWTIELMGSPDLPSNWFELDGHIAAGRKVIPIRSIDELDAAEKDTEKDAE